MTTTRYYYSPLDLGPQHCSRFKQPVRRRLTFGASEGNACTLRPWVVMTTQIRTVPVCACAFEVSVFGMNFFCAHAFFDFFVRMRFLIFLCACVFVFLCQVVRMLTVQVCACVFHQFKPHIMVCLSAGSVIVFSIT